MTDSIRAANATRLYLDGIRDGQPQAAMARYTGARYRQHSAGVPDGKEGFVTFFTDFHARNPQRDIQIRRVIEDGQYVFVHVYQNLNDGAAEWVTMDLFDTDAEGRIIEHWDVIAPYVARTASGRTMMDGSTALADPERTEANKTAVAGFARDVLIGGDVSKLADYVAERLAQHSPVLDDGPEALLRHLQGGAALRYVKVHRLIGQGNFVVLYSEAARAGTAWAVCDLFRLKDGRIVEHWDVQEEIGPPETWLNAGKF